MTTRIDGRPDDDLLSEKGFRGFPSLALMNADGEIVKKDLGRSVAAMGSAIDSIGAYYALKAKVAAGEKGLEGKLFVAQVRLGKIDVDKAKDMMGKYKLSSEDKKAVDGLIFDKEMAGWLDQARNRRMEADEFFAKVYEAYKAGRRPSDDEQSQGMFWMYLLNGAETAVDPEAFEAAFQWQLDSQRKEFMNRLESLKKKAAKKKGGE